MKLIRHSFAVAALVIATFGLVSTTTAATTQGATSKASVGRPTHSAGYCCLYFMGRWVCVPC